MRGALILIAVAAAATAIGCGSQGVEVSSSDPDHEGAVIFAERCSGCHTLTPAGTQGTANRSQRTQGPDFDQRKEAAGSVGSANRALRNQGPNLDEREESVEDVLFAIRNGGFSGAIMPQNIVVGPDAEKVAAFLAKYAGQDVEEQPRPTSAAP